MTTSTEALASIDSAALREKVRACIASSRGLTCDEIEQRLSMPHQTASARVNELMRAGVIVAKGRRNTRSGRAAQVWILVDGKKSPSPGQPSSTLPSVTAAPTINRTEAFERPPPKLVACPHCGGMRYDFEGPHAPRWRNGKKVDCRGRLL